MLDKKTLLSVDDIVKDTSEKLHRNFPTHDEYINNLLRRNYFIVKDANLVFAVAYLNKNSIDGGTAWGIEFAKMNKINIMVYNLVDKQYYIFEYITNKWIRGRHIILYDDIVAYIGTRSLGNNYFLVKKMLENILISVKIGDNDE